VTYCDVKGGWSGTGNIDADPLFVGEGRGDLHLTFDSPCRNAGTGTAPHLPQEDIEGDPRGAFWHPDPDMGADEFYTHLYTRGPAIPGAQIEVYVVGIPSLPAALAQGSGVLDPPLSTPHGDLYLKLPLVHTWTLPRIPSSGVLAFPVTVPASWLPGDQYPFQALVGPLGGSWTELTNLLVLEVR
jgi:hypothetical protein